MLSTMCQDIQYHHNRGKKARLKHFIHINPWHPRDYFFLCNVYTVTELFWLPSLQLRLIQAF